MDRKVVLIEWLDSKGMTNQWEYLDELESMPPDKCISVGFLLEETPEYKTIVQNVGRTQVLGRITIPCCAVQKVVELETEVTSSCPSLPAYPASA